MSRCFAGFDTSNYTTSCAICSEDGEVLANIRIPLPVKDGERGLRQSDALFLHSRQIPDACRMLREAIGDQTVAAVGYSGRPRPRDDSYMPCFLAGRAAAEAFAAGLGIPVYSFSHQEGHIMAAGYSAGCMQILSERSFYAFHVSGGTTEVLSVQPKPAGFAIDIVGGTLDLHAGQAIDRIGVMMGLSFPCGKEMERLAAVNRKPLPKLRVRTEGTRCHISGLENMAKKLWDESADPALVSAFALEYLAQVLVGMTKGLDQEHPGLPILYAGGVMSNRFLQSRLSERADTYFADPAFSADNAAGVALLCRCAWKKENSK